MTTPPEDPNPFTSPNPEQPAAPPPEPGTPPPGYPQGSYPYAANPAAPFGVDPITGAPYSDKSKIVAGILQLLIGWTGAGRWYIGSYGIAVAQLLTCGGLGVWALIDGILMLVGNVKDPQGRPLHP